MSMSSIDFDTLRLEKRIIGQVQLPSATTLAELTDVNIQSPQEGQVLKLVNGKWTNVDMQAVISNVIEGTAIRQGTGYTLVYNIAHGFGSRPTNVFIEGTTPEANEDYTVSWDDVNITVTYSFPPPNTGTDNLSYYYRVS